MNCQQLQGKHVIYVSRLSLLFDISLESEPDRINLNKKAGCDKKRIDNAQRVPTWFLESKRAIIAQKYKVRVLLHYEHRAL